MTKTELSKVQADLEQKIQEQQQLAEREQQQFVDQAAELHREIAKLSSQSEPDGLVQQAKHRVNQSAILVDLKSQLQQTAKDRQDAAGHAAAVQRTLNQQLKFITSQLATST